jgi:DNA-binding ferritin-like protein
MTGHLSGTLKLKKRESFSGAEIRQHDDEAAERVLASGMKALGVTDESLSNQIKSSPEKYALAWLVRKNTCVRNDWIKQRLKMGSATNFSAYLRRIETAKKGEWGYVAFQCIKKING